MITIKHSIDGYHVESSPLSGPNDWSSVTGLIRDYTEAEDARALMAGVFPNHQFRLIEVTTCTTLRVVA